MRGATDPPSAFRTMRREGGATHPIVPRPGLDDTVVSALLEQVSAVSWADTDHAYGPATDVPGQLAAVVVGDDATREEAWWNLWGSIHHQGTIYDATVPAVPILLDLAAWADHPDRAQALLLVREVGAADGVRDERSPAGRASDLRSVIAARAAALLVAWRREPPAVQRALLWLLSVDAGLRDGHQDLVDAILPAGHRSAWELEIADAVASQEEADAVFALEDWIHDGVDG